MPTISAGILLYRYTNEARDAIEVMVVHAGGPYWADRDLGAWSVPKGVLEEGEEPLAAARRELTEETGCSGEGEFLSLGSVKQRAGKIVMAWAVEGDCDAANIASNTFPMEWPPRSGKWIRIPEVDRAAWFGPVEAKEKLNPAQAPFVDRLCEALGVA